MQGCPSIRVIDLYFATDVITTYIEEIKIIEKFTSHDLNSLYNVEIKDFIIKDCKDLIGNERIIQHSINRTVSRVHQAMEAFIHNMNTIHSRGGNQVVFSSVKYGTDTSAEGRCVISEILQIGRAHV